MKTIPCDYHEPGTAGCDKGTVLTYGDMPTPPSWDQCPKCKGVGTIQVPEAFIEEKINHLIDLRNSINSEIRQFRLYLK